MGKPKRNILDYKLANLFFKVLFFLQHMCIMQKYTHTKSTFVA